MVVLSEIKMSFSFSSLVGDFIHGGHWGSNMSSSSSLCLPTYPLPSSTSSSSSQIPSISLIFPDPEPSSPQSSSSKHSESSLIPLPSHSGSFGKSAIKESQLDRRLYQQNLQYWNKTQMVFHERKNQISNILQTILQDHKVDKRPNLISLAHLSNLFHITSYTDDKTNLK